jgi:hypothetical protein
MIFRKQKDEERKTEERQGNSGIERFPAFYSECNDIGKMQWFSLRQNSRQNFKCGTLNKT